MEQGASSEELVATAEAYLAGRSRELLAARGDAVPAWAYLNTVAHAAPSRVRALSEIAPEALADDAGWMATLIFLSEQMVVMADGHDDQIRRLQVECLVPLEDRLLAAGYDGFDNAAQLLSLGRAYLTRHPNAHPPGN